MNAPPLKNETLGAVQGAEGLAENTENSLIVSADDAECKTFATMRARAALAGHTLERDAQASAYTASRWGWRRTFDSLEAVEHWLRTVTGKEVA